MPAKSKELRAAERGLTAAHKASLRASEARRRLSEMEGATRARITTANAKWQSAAEDRDRWIRRVEDLGGDPAAIMSAARGYPA